MSIDKFEEDCAGCRPAILDIKTGEVVSDDHPLMVAMNAVWMTTSAAERIAFHNFTCLNSQDPTDLRHVTAINARMQKALESLEEKN